MSTPEESLWLAVLHRAILDATSGAGIAGDATIIKAKARDWLLTANDSFELVCTLAGKCPIRTRKYVAKYIATYDTGDTNRKLVNKSVTFNGKTQTLKQWIAELNLNAKAIYARINSGWTLEDAISTPVRDRSPSIKQISTGGVVKDSGESPGTGAGSVAQDLHQTEIYQLDKIS